MCEFYVEFGRRLVETVLTPHGVFRLANPRAVVPNRTHIIRYYPFDQFASIVAVCIKPTLA